MTEKLAELGRRRIDLLDSPVLDLVALRALVDEYAAGGYVANAEDLRRRIEHYEALNGNVEN